MALVRVWRFWSLGDRYWGDPFLYLNLVLMKECWKEQLGDHLKMVRDEYYEFSVHQ